MGAFIGAEAVGQAQRVYKIPGVLFSIESLRNENPHELDIILPELLPGLLKGRHLGPARRAARIPEVNHHRVLTHLVRKPELSSVEKGYLEVRGLLPFHTTAGG